MYIFKVLKSFHTTRADACTHFFIQTQTQTLKIYFQNFIFFKNTLVRANPFNKKRLTDYKSWLVDYEVKIYPLINYDTCLIDYEGKLFNNGLRKSFN